MTAIFRGQHLAARADIPPFSQEGNRARWRARASNPVGDGSRSRVSSTLTAFRHLRSARMPGPLHPTAGALAPLAQPRARV